MANVKMLACGLILASSSFPASVLYLGTANPGLIAHPPVKLVVQQHKEVVAIDLDLSAYRGFDQVSFYTAVFDGKGSKVLTTQRQAFVDRGRYKLLTHKGLPVGVFNVDVYVDYKYNIVAWRTDTFTQAVLNVIPNQKEHNDYSRPNFGFKP